MSSDVIVHSDAMQRIEDHLRSDSSGRGGLLVGMASQTGEIVVVTSAVLGEPGQSMDDLVERAAAEHPSQRVVGWFHGHPDAGVYLSDDEVALQNSVFARPWHVLYVYDHVRDERAFFGWTDGQIGRIPNWNVTAVVRGNGADQPVALVPVEPETAAEVVIDEEPTLEPEPEAEAITDNEAVIPDDAAIAEPLVLTAPVAPTPTRTAPASSPSSKGPWLAIVGVALVAVLIAVIVINSGDDDDPAGSSNSTSPSLESTPNSVITTDAPTTSDATVIDGSQPPIATTVETPASRVGTSAVQCTPTEDSTYTPTGDCFVPLVNGNILIFKASSLGCSEPTGLVTAPTATTFTVGVDGDPLAVTADGALIPKCSDLTYAKNVMAGGSGTLDGLCGSSGTQINEATARCFGQNPSTGAMASLMRSATQNTTLVGSCFSAGATDPTTAELTWSGEGVDTTWRVDSVAFDPAAAQFTATATKAEASATAPLTCA